MFKRFLVITSGTLTINLAHAAEGSYIGANIGYANIANWWTGSMAVTVNGGYAFNNYFATEGGANWIYPTSAQYPNNGALSGSYLQRQSFIDIAAKGSLPFSDIFNLYAKAGIGAGFVSNTANSYSGWSAPSGVNPGFYMALGGEFALSAHFDIIGEDYGLIPLGGSNYGNINILGFGLKYNF